MMEEAEENLDPRIQIELENLNQSTEEINRLEIELDEANTTFRMLLNESTRRLKLLSKKLGSCIEKARPYYEAVEISKQAQVECQRAAVLFQRANEIHAAAKETVALAEQRFLSKQHEWQFDNAWQEMLNHATLKVMEAERKKAESGREHQKCATAFNAAEQKVQSLEEQLKKHIIKSNSYFEEKAICQQQLNTQKERIEFLKNEICKVKRSYARSLKELEQISNEIHQRRQGLTLKYLEAEILNRPREPGVGAELTHSERPSSFKSSLPDFRLELDKCELRSLGSCSGATSSAVSEKDETEINDLEGIEESEMEERPIEGGDGKTLDPVWEAETSQKLDQLSIAGFKDVNYKTEVTIHPSTSDKNGSYKTELTILPKPYPF